MIAIFADPFASVWTASGQRSRPSAASNARLLNARLILPGMNHANQATTSKGLRESLSCVRASGFIASNVRSQRMTPEL